MHCTMWGHCPTCPVIPQQGHCPTCPVIPLQGHCPTYPVLPPALHCMYCCDSIEFSMCWTAVFLVPAQHCSHGLVPTAVPKEHHHDDIIWGSVKLLHLPKSLFVFCVSLTQQYFPVLLFKRAICQSCVLCVKLPLCSAVLTFHCVLLC